MFNVLPSPSSIPVTLDFTQDLAVLGIALLALVVLSGVMIVASAAADAFSHHPAHSH